MDLILWLIIGVIIVILIGLSVISVWAAVRYSNSSSAIGNVNTKLAKDSNNGDKMSLYYGIYATDLTSPVISAQFRLGKDSSGLVLKTITLKQQMENNKNVYRANGVWDLTMQNISESEHPTMDHAQILNALRSGNIYFSINTQRQPTGELTAQITKF